MVEPRPLPEVPPHQGLREREGFGPGVYTEATSSHTPLVPEVTGPPVPASDPVRHREVLRQGPRWPSRANL